MNNDQQERKAPKKDDRPQRYGWAPGKYFNTCPTCTEAFWGDKRASLCADCAYGIMGTIEEHPPEGLVALTTLPPVVQSAAVDLERLRVLLEHITHHYVPMGTKWHREMRDLCRNLHPLQITTLTQAKSELEAENKRLGTRALIDGASVDELQAALNGTLERLSVTQATLLQRDEQITHLTAQLAAAREDAKTLGRWRSWARNVFLSGDKSEMDDATLKDRLCAAADARVREMRVERDEVMERGVKMREIIEDVINHDGGNRYNYREITELLTEALTLPPTNPVTVEEVSGKEVGL